MRTRTCTGPQRVCATEPLTTVSPRAASGVGLGVGPGVGPDSGPDSGVPPATCGPDTMPGASATVPGPGPCAPIVDVR